MPVLTTARALPKTERDISCWNDCGRPRAMLYPPHGGNLLSIYCTECQRASRVLAHLERERQQMETQL
jgi:hypothetical protein